MTSNTYFYRFTFQKIFTKKNSKTKSAKEYDTGGSIGSGILRILFIAQTIIPRLLAVEMTSEVIIFIYIERGTAWIVLSTMLASIKDPCSLSDERSGSILLSAEIDEIS